MMPSSPTPKLPLWIFILTDVALLLAGLFIAARSPSPLSSTAVLSIVACVIAGAIVLFVPLVSHVEREKNEALDDRQRALEALASTVTTSAEQISIAASGLHAIAELAQKNLRSAEQLPAVLSAKISEFETLLTNAQADEREELKKELAQVRAAESDRLEAIASKVSHASGELTKLEAAAHKHLVAAQAALAAAPEALTSATNAALAKISDALAAMPPPAVSPPAEPLRGPTGESGTESSKPAKPAGKAIDEGLHIVPIVPPTAAPFTGNIVTVTPNPAFEVTMPPFGGNLLSSSPLPDPVTPSAPLTPPEPAAPPPPDEPHQSPAAQDNSGPASAPVTEEPKPVKKRAPRKPKPVEASDPALVLESEEPSSATPAPAVSEFSQIAPDESPRASAEVTETVISSDGATRLLVTAYIGIGNRLFIRGEGPGLSWDKGVPLQFVSIGKWRWETSDAAAPVKFKLFKNDETECAALGSRTLDPGQQAEVNATF